MLTNNEILKVTETSNELEIPMKRKKPTSGTIKLQNVQIVDIIYLEGDTLIQMKKVI